MRLSPQWCSYRLESDHLRTGRPGIVQLSYYTAAYREYGDGPPLVLIPGLAGGIELVSSLAQKLSYHFRVITLQLRAEDEPFLLRRRFDLADLVDDLAEFMDVLHLEHPDIVGVSFGGILGLEFAARHPGRLRSLAVQGCGARFESGLIKSVAALVLKDYPLPPTSQFVNQFFQLLFGRGPQPPALVESVARLCWQTDQSVMRHRFELVRKLNLVPRLSRIRVPVLTMAAERDLLVSCDSLQDLYTGLKQAHFVKLRRGGHLAFVADPGTVAREIVNFSDSVTA
jgi:pimeloyl-ACP methyl ester carboxylesterase